MPRDFSSIPAHLWPHVIINRKELLMLVPYSMAHIYRLEAAGKFPRRIKLSDNKRGWRLSEILKWLADRPMADLPGPHEDA
ncbi:MAG TPA: AlpA family phage regulatory protein [Devosiaceae bacterium]|jgi:prophage regulatory protein|nr:AlpA family phage regulatory protein [Devosiaceae bacterium]